MALLLGIRTANNTDGHRRSPIIRWRTWFPLLKWTFSLLLGGFLLLLLLSLLTDSYVKQRNTSQKLNRLGVAIVKYHQTQTRWPLTLEEVVANSPVLRDLTVDSWGKAILYQPNPARQTFSLTSSGKDQQLNTPDDLVQVIQTMNRQD